MKLADYSFIDIHTHAVKSSIAFQILNISTTEPLLPPSDIPFSCGIHPWYLTKENEAQSFKRLEEWIKYPNCIALGECGLDKIQGPSLDRQMAVFEKQIALAITCQKPMILHVVKAHQELLSLKVKQPEKMILHGFNKKREVAEKLIDYGFNVSIGHAVLSNESLMDTVKNIPLNQLFLETDDQAQLNISEIYAAVASIKGLAIQELQREIKNNYIRVFNE